ncbi:unnamed protein product [Periconia digitata]|uniref:Uncharacterized protein n=1 Tax=Periconia digitata TaxID=1303443 RepID=A0A9W4USJ7_9PLEO|nr:unnamed protein product [Periconia digitata]
MCFEDAAYPMTLACSPRNARCQGRPSLLSTLPHQVPTPSRHAHVETLILLVPQTTRPYLCSPRLPYRLISHTKYNNMIIIIIIIIIIITVSCCS